jgi:hypothetical protein
MVRKMLLDYTALGVVVGGWRSYRPDVLATECVNWLGD